MLLVGALFALFIAGFWVYCLTDVALTPGSECRGMPKAAWLVVVAGTFVAGGIAWLVARRRGRSALIPATRGGTARVAGGDTDDAGNAGNAGGPAPPPATEGHDRPLPPDGRSDPPDWDGPGPGGPDAPGISVNLEAEAALLRHPAGRARRRGTSSRPHPKGPDDDPEFLSLLNRTIHGHGTGDKP